MIPSGRHSNRRPDEEGIKTFMPLPPSPETPIPTADLMKKGLRRGDVAVLATPDVIPTADLMKKGLRHLERVAFLGVEKFQPQT